MNTKKILVAATLLVTANSWAADASLTLAGTTDYRFRGISQSAGDPAIQGSFDLAFDNGFYAGTWASNVEFGDDASVEVDWYGGYFHEFSETVGLDVMLSYYTYPGYDYNADYLELVSKLYVSDFTFQYAYANDFFNTGESAQYAAIDYSYPVSESAGIFSDISIDAHYGYSYGNYWKHLDIGDYSDYSIGVSAGVKSVNLSLAYLNNNVDTGMHVPSGAYQNDSTVLFTFTTTFDLFSF